MWELKKNNEFGGRPPFTGKIKKHKYQRTDPYYSGTIKDLYDFNYKLGGASRRAAIVQSGFDTLGLAAGKVFKNEAGFSGEVILPNGE